MKPLDVLIVEDELLIAHGIRIDLERMGHRVPAPICTTFEEAVEALEHHRPDLMILDISLEGQRTGVQLAEYVNRNWKIPFIFLTSHISENLVKSVAGAKPAGILTKPYWPENLRVLIQVAMAKVTASDKEPEIVLQGKSGKESHDLGDLLFVKAEGAYTRYYFKGKDSLQRKTLHEAFDELPQGHPMIRIHRSYAVNKLYISSFTSQHVMICGFKIPISRSLRKDTERLLSGH